MITRLFIGGLSDPVTDRDLVELFSKHGAARVVSVDRPTDRRTGRPLSFAFVHVEATPEAAQSCIDALTGVVLRNRSVRVERAARQAFRPRQSLVKAGDV